MVIKKLQLKKLISAQKIKLRLIKKLKLKLRLIQTPEPQPKMLRLLQQRLLLLSKLWPRMHQTQMPSQQIQPLTQLPLLRLLMIWKLHLPRRPLKLTKKLLQKLLFPKWEMKKIQPRSSPSEDHQMVLQSDMEFTNSPMKVELHTLESKCTEPESQLQEFNINQLCSQLISTEVKLPNQHHSPQRCNTELISDLKVSKLKMLHGRTSLPLVWLILQRSDSTTLSSTTIKMPLKMLLLKVIKLLLNLKLLLKPLPLLKLLPKKLLQLLFKRKRKKVIKLLPQLLLKMPLQLLPQLLKLLCKRWTPSVNQNTNTVSLISPTTPSMIHSREEDKMTLNHLTTVNSLPNGPLLNNWETRTISPIRTLTRKLLDSLELTRTPCHIH